MSGQLEGRLPCVCRGKQALRDGVPRDGPYPQARLHRTSQPAHRMVLQQPQHPDVLSGSGSLGPGLQSAPQDDKALRQDPARQRPRIVQGSRLSLQQGQMMERVEADPFPFPHPPVAGHLFPLGEARHFPVPGLHHDRMMGPRHEHLLPPATQLPDHPLHHCVAPLLQPIPDPLGRGPLLARHLAVRLQDLLDPLQVSSQLRPPPVAAPAGTPAVPCASGSSPASANTSPPPAAPASGSLPPPAPDVVTRSIVPYRHPPLTLSQGAAFFDRHFTHVTPPHFLTAFDTDGLQSSGRSSSHGRQEPHPLRCSISPPDASLPPGACARLGWLGSNRRRRLLASAALTTNPQILRSVCMLS